MESERTDTPYLLDGYDARKIYSDWDLQVVFKDVEDSSRPARSVLTLKPLPTIDPKDKGKSVLEEPKPTKKMTRSDFDDAQKGLQGQKEAKTVKIRQGTKETRTRVKNQPKIKAGSARHSKKERQRPKMKSKDQL
ncbi:hypothetical protein Tco_1578352 [Tanacetum coccineum]